MMLVAWQIPDLVALFLNAPKVPDTWPDDRFDMVWIFDSAGAGWSFSQKPQLFAWRGQRTSDYVR
jgi:hypothetical protein